MPVADPPNPNIVWEASCSGTLAGDTCQGYCAAGSAIDPSVPLATCGADGNWTVAGGCSTGDNTSHAWWLFVVFLTRGRGSCDLDGDQLKL